MKKLLQYSIGVFLFILLQTANAEVAIVVHPSSSANSIDASQVSRIFLGKTSKLSDGSKVTPIDQDESSPIRDNFYREVVGKSASQLKSYWSKLIFTGKGKPPETVNNDAEVKSRVAKELDAIGYMDAGQVDDTVKVLLTIK